MTARRPGGERRYKIAQAERLANRLQVHAMLAQREAEQVGNEPDAKAWWVVARAANEALQAIKTARGAPGITEAKPFVDRPKRPNPAEDDLDHLGVPKRRMTPA